MRQDAGHVNISVSWKRKNRELEKVSFYSGTRQEEEKRESYRKQKSDEQHVIWPWPGFGQILPSSDFWLKSLPWLLIWEITLGAYVSVVIVTCLFISSISPPLSRLKLAHFDMLITQHCMTYWVVINLLTFSISSLVIRCVCVCNAVYINMCMC